MDGATDCEETDRAVRDVPGAFVDEVASLTAAGFGEEPAGFCLGVLFAAPFGAGEDFGAALDDRDRPAGGLIGKLPFDGAAEARESDAGVCLA